MVNEIGKEFMEKTQYKYLDPSDQTKGHPEPPLESEFKEKEMIIKLPRPSVLKIMDVPLRTVIEGRESHRKYSTEEVTLEELSWLLWCTQGLRGLEQAPTNLFLRLRNVPSAGARHALDTYILANNVESLTPGLYRFIVSKHSLIPITISSTIANDLANACLKQSHIAKGAITFFWVAIVERMKWRYSERGYRYLFLDAGHICQNLYLAAENINCGVCAIAAFEDEVLNTVLGLNGRSSFVLYLASLGKKL